MYSGCELTFDSLDSWSFNIDTAGNVIIFGADNSSWSPADNRKNSFLVLGEGPTLGIKGSFYSSWKTCSKVFRKANTNFSSCLHYNTDNSYFFYGKEIFKFKVNNKNIYFPTHFYLESISHWFNATESSEVSLNENKYDFSVDYHAVDKSGVINIRNHLMTKNNIK